MMLGAFEDMRLYSRRSALAFGTLDGRPSSSPSGSVLRLLAHAGFSSEDGGDRGASEARAGESDGDGAEPGGVEAGTLGSGSMAFTAPSLEEALERYEFEELGSGEVSRMRAVYKRFIYDSTSELSRGSLHDALVQMGYLGVSHQQAEDIAATISKFSTFDFPEFCLFVEKCSVQERTTVMYAAVTWRESSFREGYAGGNVSGLQRFLHSLGVVTTTQPVRDTMELAGLQASGRGLGTQDLLRFLAAWRLREGFTAEDVARARKVHEQLGGSLPRSSQLVQGLVDFAGPHYVGHVQRLLEVLPPGFGFLPVLSFPEFLIWARRLRDMDMSELWSLFKELDAGGDGLVGLDRIERVLAKAGFSLLSDEVKEFVTEAGVDCEKPLDFSSMVELVQVCRRSSGFCRREVDELVAVFRRFDVQRTGELPRLQVLELLRSLGHTTRLDDVHKFLDEVDVNKNGTMDEKEFIMLMRRRREQDFQQAKAVFDGLQRESEQKDAYGSELSRALAVLGKAHPRHRREQDVQRRRAIAASPQGKGKDLPRWELERALAIMGQKLCPAVLEEVCEAAGDCRSLQFDAFLRAVERCRAVAAAEGRRRAGMAASHFELLRSLFAASDPAGFGFIELGELVRMLSSCEIQVNTVQGRQKMFESLDAARAAALQAGVEASEVGDQGSSQVHFYDFVHVVGALIREREGQVVCREREVLAEVRFSDTEASHFRDVFSSMIADSKANQPDPSTDEDTLPSLGELLNKFTAVSLLPRSAFMRGMCSIGLRMSAHQREQLSKQLRVMATNREGLDFPGFLQVLRWMLDTDFAGIHKAAESKAQGFRPQRKESKPKILMK